MSEHVGKSIEFGHFTCFFENNRWKRRLKGCAFDAPVSDASAFCDRLISHLLTRAETAERERDEAQQIAQKYEDRYFDCSAERDALRAQIEASTAPEDAVGKLYEALRENLVGWGEFRHWSPWVKLPQISAIGDMEQFTAAVRPVLDSLAAPAKPTARELTNEEVMRVAIEINSPLTPGHAMSKLVNACIAHACTVAQPISLPSDMEIAQGLEDVYCRRHGATPVRLIHHSLRCDARLAQAAYVRSLIEGKAAQPTPEQPAPDREKVIELARDLCTLNTHMTHEELFEYSEDFLAAADAYRKGE